jgi:hypothetical protein
LPFIGFGQDNCGEQPLDPFAYKNQITSTDKQTALYRKYAKALKKYHDCIFKDIDIPLKIDKNTNLVEFEGVIKANGMTKKEIYFSIKEWFASSKNISLNQSDQNYAEKDKLYEVDDLGNGVIITQMHSEIRTMSKRDNTAKVDESQLGGYYKRYWIKYTFKILIKEGRFKYFISSFIKDKYLIHDLKTLSSKKKRFLSNKKTVTTIEDLVVDNLYDKRGDLNIENAYLKLKLLTINSEIAKNLQYHIKSQKEDNDW